MDLGGREEGEHNGGSTPLDMSAFNVAVKDLETPVPSPSGSPRLLHTLQRRSSELFNLQRKESSRKIIRRRSVSDTSRSGQDRDKDDSAHRVSIPHTAHDEGTTEHSETRLEKAQHLKDTIDRHSMDKGSPLHNKLMESVSRIMVMEINKDRAVGGDVKEFTLRELYRYVLSSFPNEEGRQQQQQIAASSASIPQPGGLGASAPYQSSYSPYPPPQPIINVSISNSSHGMPPGGTQPPPSSQVPHLFPQQQPGSVVSPATSAYAYNGRKGYPAGQATNVLRMRDIRNLVASSSTSAPYIAVRRNVILLSFETLRAIVLYNRMLIILDQGSDGILMDVSRNLRALELGDDSDHNDRVEVSEIKRQRSKRDIHDGVPSSVANSHMRFEMYAVEAILTATSNALRHEVSTVIPKVKVIVADMEGSSKAATSADHNDRFRSLRNVVGLLEGRANQHKTAIWEFMDDDEDMAYMSLTDLAEHPERFEPPLSPDVLENDEVELLLEAHMTQISSLANQLHIIKERMTNTEAQVMVKLDIARNKLLTIDLLFTAASLCVGAGTYVSGIFGMNLHNPWFDEVEDFYFIWTAVGTSLIVFGAAFAIFVYLYRFGLLMG